MSVETVKEYFRQWELQDKVLEFPVSSATVELAAQALGCEPARIAKSLSFKVGDRCVLILAAGDAKVDNPKFKGQFHTKAKMLSFDEVPEYTGHPVGGVCPFALKDGVEVYLDRSLQRFDTVFPACGSANSAIELTCDELERCACGVQGWADLCKGWQEEP